MRPLVLAFALVLLPSAMQGVGADAGADAAAAGAAPAAADGADAPVAAYGAVAPVATDGREIAKSQGHLRSIQNNRRRGGPEIGVPSAVVSGPLNNRR